MYGAYDGDCWLHIVKKCVNVWSKQKVGILLTTRASNNFKKKNGSCMLLFTGTTAVLM